MSDRPVALLTRLLPPRLPPGHIARPELAARVAAGFSGRLVAVIAGAGYGKTTVLAEALQRAPWPWLWCSCDERLTASLLVTHLVEALRRPVPGFGAALDLSGAPADQVAALANEVASTTADDLIVALDDVHALPPPAEELLAGLVRDLPPTIHFALASRSPLPFPTGRLRAIGLREFGERELSFRPEEAEALLRATVPDLAPETARGIVRRTEGWAAGLILAAQAAEAGAPEAATSGGGHVFEYMAEEVLESQADDLQRFLLDTAVFERFTPELAERTSGRADAGEVCRALVQRHLFTVCLDEEAGWYRYHHLFQAVVRRRLAQQGAGALERAHRRAADAWLEGGEPAEAVGHLIAAGELEGAADTLEPIAEAMLDTPEAATLAGWLAVLPKEHKQSRPGLILAESSVSLSRGRFTEGIQALDTAVGRLLAMGQHERATQAFARVLLTHTPSWTTPEQAISVGERYLPLIDPGTATLPIARVLLASCYGWVGRFGEAERELAAARALPAAGRIPLLDAYVSMVQAHWIDRLQGRMEEALRGIDASLAMIEANRDADTLGLAIQAHGYRAFAYTAAGFHEEALAAGEGLVRTAEQLGSGPYMRRAVAWLRLLALTPLERWAELEETLAELAAEGPALLATPAGLAFLAFSARLAAHRGDRAGVRRHVEAARGALAGHGPQLDHIGILCEMALACDEVGLRTEALELAGQALSAGESLRMPWHLARAAIVAAHCHGPDEDGDRALDLALRVTAEYRYEAVWHRRERPLAAPLLARALLGDLGPSGLAARLAAECGGEVFREVAHALRAAPPPIRVALADAAADAPAVEAESLAELLHDADAGVRAAAARGDARLAERPRPALRLDGLGGFAALRGGVRVPRSSFGRDRAPAVLAALLCAGRPVRREELTSWIWPELPSERAGRRLSAAVRTLRRALEPHLSAGRAGSIIVAEPTAYWIALHDEDSWDVDAFLSLAGGRAGETTDQTASLPSLMAAEAAYPGPLYPEWPDAEWAAPRRAQVAETHEAVIQRLAETLLAAGRPAEAAPRYRRLIELQPEREAAHRGLMQAHAAAGERALALRQYQACRTLLRRRHGVEPDPKTRALYLELLGDRAVADDVAEGPAGTVTIVFTDIERSTELTERLGDRRWMEVLERHDRLLRGAAADHGGHEVKAQGDGLMLAFGSARRAIEFAIAVQRRLASAARSGESVPLVRIGMHTGEAIRRGDDLFGHAVNMAARIAGVCAGGEIAVSDLVRQLTERAGDLRFAGDRVVPLRGIAEPQRIHFVHWAGSAADAAATM